MKATGLRSHINEDDVSNISPALPAVFKDTPYKSLIARELVLEYAGHKSIPNLFHVVLILFVFF